LRVLFLIRQQVLSPTSPLSGASVAKWSTRRSLARATLPAFICAW